MKPALTAEEWADPDRRVEREGFWVYIPDGTVPVVGAERSGVGIGTMRKEVAALALYGEPYGFSREDVRWLREELGGPAWDREKASALADRIEALLPPEKEGT